MLLKIFNVIHLPRHQKNPFFRLCFNKNLSQFKQPNEWPKSDLTLKQCKKEFKQYLKPSYEQPRCKTLLPKPPSKCQTAGDYVSARKSLDIRIKKITNNVEKEYLLIANDLKNRLEINKTDRANQMKELFQKTTGKLDQLIKLDVSYGGWMRNETLLLNDEIRRAFDALERSVIPDVKCLDSMLKELQSDMLICFKQAQEAVASCRRYRVPSQFADCVKEKLNEAMKMLDEIDGKALLKLKEIAAFREGIVKTHERIARETVKVNRQKAMELSEYLEKCIVKLNKSNNTKR